MGLCGLVSIISCVHWLMSRLWVVMVVGVWVVGAQMGSLGNRMGCVMRL